MNEAEHETFERLAWRYFDRRLAPSEEAELRETLRDNPLHCKRFAEISIVHSALDRVVNIRRDNVLPMRRARGRLAFRGMAAAAAVLLTALGAFWLLSDRVGSPALPTAVALSELKGETTVFRGDKALAGAIGMRLKPGDRVNTGADAAATLTDSDTGMRIGLAADTVLTMKARDGLWHLGSGRIEVLAPSDGDRSLAFTTHNARTTVAGTRFELVTAADLTRVAVEEGAVDFADLVSGAAVSVETGHAAVASPRGPPVAFRLAATDGLLALYLFNEGAGSTLYDVSGIGEPMNLTIGNPANVEWLPDRLRVLGAANIAFKGRPDKLNQAIRDNRGLSIDAQIQLRFVEEGERGLFMVAHIGRWRQTWTQTTRKTDPNAATYRESVNRTIFVLLEKDRQVESLFYHDGRLNARTELGKMALSRNPPTEMRFAPVPVDHFDHDDARREWRGDIFMLAIYGRALTPAEIEEAARHAVAPTPQP